MHWYQVVISLAPEEKNLIFPAGSDINKAIDIGTKYLEEHGNLDSSFTIMTCPYDHHGETIYSSAQDENYQGNYRLLKCEQGLDRDNPHLASIELPAFLKRQAF